MSKHWEYKGASTPYISPTTYGTSHGTSYTVKTCEHPPKPVKVGDIEIFGCAQRDVDLAVKQGFDVISPLTQSCSSEFFGYYGLLLWFPIADMTAPEPQRLRVHATRLIDLARAGNRVVTFCIGSHGRTGTVLATCIGLLEPDTDPIAAVRERHCKESVETFKQIEAVFLACGREVPEKYKESTYQKKYQPAWVQEGKTWSASSKEITNDLVPAGTDDAWTCDICTQLGGVGINKLHWFGQVRAHMDCYENAEKAAKAKIASASAAIGSSTTPSADSPPAVSNMQQTALPIGGYPIEDPPKKNSTSNTVEDGDVDEDPPEFVGASADERPFFDKWSTKQKRKYKFVENEKDQFGDLRCPLCLYLITNPYTAKKDKNLAVHLDCEKAKSLLDSVPLCVICDNAYASPELSEFCFDCGEAIEEVSIGEAQSNGTIVDTEKEEEDKI